ncbi:MAG: carbon-nitrogen hydrolase family protein [Burkholderiales bacterium]|nr:carbon-nitrogen hydrolase family protein [Burkholderiales bacterium]
MTNSIKIAAIQMVSSSCLDENLLTAQKLCIESVRQGAEIVVLPEYFIYIGEANSREIYEIATTTIQEKILSTLSKLAKTQKVYIVAGSIPTQDITSDKLFNTCFVFNSAGKIVCQYNKIHTFKYQSSKLKFDEAINYSNGDKVVAFNYKGFNLGLAICFDIRFPELFRQLLGVDAFIIPAAFISETGQAHWETILRTRAIENQCYVIASAQGGTHSNGRKTYGHSLIINPWGTVEHLVATGEGVIIGSINKDKITQIRTQLPAIDCCKLL